MKHNNNKYDLNENTYYSIFGKGQDCDTKLTIVFKNKYAIHHVIFSNMSTNVRFYSSYDIKMVLKAYYLSESIRFCHMTDVKSVIS